MYRLGLRLVARSGREAFLRLVVTSLAVGVGVAILLAVLAEFHAFQATSTRPSWESTQGTAVSTAPATSGAELWNYSENIYKGRFIEQLDVAALGPGAPRIPGLPRIPAAGQFYVSPALSRLLKTVPADELGDRFPGQQAGLLGDAALSGPDELAIVVGYSPSQLVALPGTVEVSRIASAPQLMGTTNLYRLAFGMAAVIVLFPLMILINTATRLAATRREERLAALRLIGATPRQVNVVASVDAVVTASAGVVIGVLAFLAIRPLLESISFSGVQFFGYTVTPTLWGYLAMVVLVPLLAALSSLVSLRRVWITPLGVSRRTTPRPPGWWRVLPIFVGIPLFIAPLVSNPGNPDGTPAFIGLFLIMAGLVLGGSWLTMQISRMLARVARGPSALLAARRLADNPKGAFRTSAGLVLAVFAGSLVACIVPAFNAAQSTGAAAQLTKVLKVPLRHGPGRAGLDPKTGSQLVSYLDSQTGVTVIPIYANPAADRPPVTTGPSGAPGASHGGPNSPVPQEHALVSPANPAFGPSDSVVSCSAIRALPALGACAPGVAAVQASFGELLTTDNPIYFNKDLPAVPRSSPPATERLAGLHVSALLVKTNNPDTLERVRTYVTDFEAASTETSPSHFKGGGSLSEWQMGTIEPETFGEVTQIRNNDDKNIERVVLAIVALILIVAGCSLAVSVAGSLLDRKRPFTLLRLSGTPLKTLTRVVLLESIVPLVGATVVAAGVAIAIAEPPLRALFAANLGEQQNFASAAHPDLGYYITMLGGLALSALVVLATMPLLNRITQPEHARFE
jgi:FtsX-like permease family